ncbi:phosphatase PAP2 family protein [Cellulomonas fimi]|uniref:Phosphoesterase PA-phosphatase related protein n=1 Tax=Cellulomonas fimi (strain ATCC 484 / DSM 20113 / JCM 1341 / CCUG 24087 / LMG 16345 / NBRC 15513 / NCIMB 8980 / NCTC 7547 / NRS-133) TaxID=590998 RepID=F4H2F7_CELFA|nr:phosphatase PAP2 family protein [Cellulomonas fimi]AEE47577.1 phosphoesterase PA-phosphatase related protein [Cellulomonas fimi ATCC 484]NNH08811.1 phosphatase PAP2 family protein [Cellulomonas fimi]VEH36568.1 undecaprenyl pyrophosphate phosphatase [Cellulomonas fimi]
MHATTVRRRALVRAATFGVVAAAPVLVLAFLVRGELSALVRLDTSVIAAATDATRARPGLRTALVAWQAAFQAVWVNLAGTALCVWVWRRHQLGTRALWAFGTLMAGWMLQLAAKGVVQRARPVVEDAVEHAPGSSFPSGHAANTTVAAVTLTLLVWPLLGRTARVVVPAVAGTLVLATAADRVLLGVHYPSDVVAGILLGGAIAGASYVGYRGFGGTTRPPADVPDVPHGGDAPPDDTTRRDGPTPVDAPRHPLRPPGARP